MAHHYFEAKKLKRACELNGVEATRRHLREALINRHVRSEDFSIRDLFEGMIDNGSELLRMMDTRRKSHGSTQTLWEASQAVDMSAFSNITGQIIYNKVLEGYQNPAFLWPELCETMQTVFLENERLPGVGGSGDLSEVVDEGQPYPTVGLNEEYVDFGVTLKRGFIMPITREIIVADRTGEVLNRASESGFHYMGVNKEKRVMNVVTGQVNPYKRNNVASNTYQTSGGYVNAYSAGNNLLVSWRSVENQELLFDGITDPNTGEPILVTGEMILLAPSALKMTGLRVVNVETIGQVDNSASTSTVRQYGPNPLRTGLVNGGNVKVLSNAYVKLATGSTTQWFYGQPKRAFLYREVWGIETEEASGNLSEACFTSDIWMRFKVSERGMIGVQNPRFMTLGQ